MRMGQSITNYVSRRWNVLVSLVSLFGGYEIGSSNLVCTAIAVGQDVFLPDSTVLIELLMRIQSRFYAVFSTLADNRQLESPIDPSDTQLQHYLIGTWAKVCQAMGPSFEPYLPIVMPTLLDTAGVKPDISVFGTGLSIVLYVDKLFGHRWRRK